MKPATTTLLVITDGRGDCLQRTLHSFDEMAQDDITYRVLIDDSANHAYARWLDEHFPHFEIVHHAARRGFGDAIQSGWDNLPECDFVFHCEDDFVFERPFSILDMQRVLEAFPYLAQIVLKRQPWNPQEFAAGGIVEQHPSDYREIEWHGLHWLFHQRFFSTNPSLYRYDLTRLGWPAEDQSEGKFSIRLRDKGYWFAFWGKRGDANWVTHIGTQRVGNGY